MTITFLGNVLRHRREASFGLVEPLFSVAAQHEGDRRPNWMNMPRKPPLFQPGTLQVDWRRAETRLDKRMAEDRGCRKDLVL
jgi:hypothetical protein